MKRVVLISMSLVLLAGCKDEIRVEDNSPDARERGEAMETCLGTRYTHLFNEKPFAQRLACVQAIYGR